MNASSDDFATHAKLAALEQATGAVKQSPNADCSLYLSSLRGCAESEEALQETVRNNQQTIRQPDEEFRDLKDQLNANADADQCKLILPAVCPGLADKENTQDGGGWRFTCKRGPYGAEIRRVKINFNDCLRTCSRESACKGINYYPDSSTCILMKTTEGMGSYIKKDLIGATLLSRV
ncbi:hypothetical protein BDW42DRAFT_192815 [Aspergillus taichungensis]|uniref:Apple domain-containing protein n=1 Tax=Aspergillus taichungensis TaxID=482145 RepID=A0A2J5HZ31_9EURO|nr:hypothetical protein BDW42DRAFT_192815 [Aspergillus taichungensis]